MADQITIPSAVLYLQGAVNTLFGLYGLLQPTSWRDQLSTNFGSPLSEPAAVTIRYLPLRHLTLMLRQQDHLTTYTNLPKLIFGSLQLINMGLFTLFAASRASLHRRALIARTCVHLLTAGLFWRMGGKMKEGAVLDGGFALMSAVAVPFVKP